MRTAADAGLIADVAAWRGWRELRSATRRAYDEAKAQQVVQEAQDFCADAAALLAASESSQ